MKTILITGGAGYIGSHTLVAFLQEGYEVVVLDDLSNSSEVVFERVKTITGKTLEFVCGDISDRQLLDAVFAKRSIEGVIHFAGYKAVGESVNQPLKYYRNNVLGSLVLFEAMQAYGCKKLVFSSSATVYGDPGVVAYTEDLPLAPVNPYGQTKKIVEDMLRDLAASDPDWSVSLLRYFNPVGAHSSGLIGEDPLGIPNNLMPYIAKVAVGELEQLHIFGNDYPTVDGTGVRDYIHVQDLATGHLAAYDVLSRKKGCHAYNLGTGKGYSVLQALAAFSTAAGRDLPYKIVERRPGDLAEYYAVPDYSYQQLGWTAQYGLEEMVSDHWNWQRNNPQGYKQ